MPLSLQEPEKELRFTRVGQALPFWWAAAVLLAAAITLLATSYYRDVNPGLPHPAWALLPVAFAVVLGRLAFRMTRHAYLILTPLGVELFPFIRPQQGMRVIYWQEIAFFEVNAAKTLMTLHFDRERTGGIHLSLKPIPRPRRDLLIRAVDQRLSPDDGIKK